MIGSILVDALVNCAVLGLIGLICVGLVWLRSKMED